jgi:hypothetical protein
MSSITDLTGATASSGSASVQGTQHHHGHHHKSISDQVSQMGSAIDNAVTAGTMTSDQAAALKKELADVTQTLSQTTQAAATGSSTSGTSSSSSAAQTTQTNPLSQLSDADRQKVFTELQDVRKQLHAANAPQGASASSQSSYDTNAVSNLFSQIDTDNSGSISKDEFTQFLAQVGANSLGYNQQGNNNSAASVTGSLFSTLA